MIDLSKSEKLPAERRYFNISVIWIFYFREVLRLLYRLRIPHELVTLASIAFGTAAAALLYHGSLLLAAAALHLKDLFDACDGALARLTGRGHLIGRYLDSLGDFLALTLVFGAIALRAAQEISPYYLLWGALAIASTFLQCSFFNYYQLAYLERFGISTLSSRRNEVARTDLEDAARSPLGTLLLSILRLLYLVVYGWQDRLVAAVDNMLFKRCPKCERRDWFGYRPLMVAQSALCFGTHIFVVIAFALAGRPHWSLLFVSVLMNFYLIALLWYRRKHFSQRPVAAVLGAETRMTKEQGS